ncbi:hypothetical protein Bhyg_05015 [Pseudolycoriella hygida]|uniref:Uncharacterized protein n=1 Tax=Pseudolycoriella hygida TaxID=35572 RepID=A0A9Q0SAF0_9DIPT|nr:hypothetical protein Bhyg_05015 [Pseudolycoriella hygida]
MNKVFFLALIVTLALLAVSIPSVEAKTKYFNFRPVSPMVQNVKRTEVLEIVAVDSVTNGLDILTDFVSSEYA